MWKVYIEISGSKFGLYEGRLRMNIENIQCFISLAECLNFTRAAEREHITQTTMSHKVSVLEKELGVKLLYRDTKQVFLTNAGTRFYSQAKEIIKMYHQTVEEIQNVQKDSQSELKIGIGIYEHALLSKFMNSFMEKNKGKVKITCMEEHTLTLIQDFQDGLFDVILCNDSFSHKFLTSELRNMGSMIIDESPYVLVLHKDSPLAAYDPVPLDKLKTQNMITMKSVPESELKIEFKGFFTFKDAVYVNSCNSKLVMANAGFGFTWLPSYALESSSGYDNLLFRRSDPPYNLRKTYLYYKKNSENPMVKKFVESVRKIVTGKIGR